MRYLRLALLPLVFAACSEQTPVASLDDAPAFNFANAPAESGVVTRGEILWGTTIVDFESGLRSVIGIPAGEFCLGSGDFSILDVMSVATGPGNEVVVIAGEAYAEVWPVGPFDCDVFTTSDPIASGTVTVTRTDNDWNLDGGRTNAYGWRANGTLYGSDGAAYRFSEVVALQWPDGDPTNVVRNLSVSLRPIGN